MKRLILGIATLSVCAAPTFAEERILKCDMLTTFRKPWFGDTDWVHIEKKITKHFKLDEAEKKVFVYNDRRGEYVPICSDKNTACAVSWSDSSISVDATKAPDDPVPPHLDFRRSFTLNNNKAHFVIADYGDSNNGKANMSWSFDGSCQKGAMPTRSPGPGAHSATYVDALIMPVSDKERDQALAGRVGNTMTGLSAGGRSWFHMWMFENGIVYTGDGDDITNEGTLRQIYVGKEAGGAYRLCEKPIPAEGMHGCYPLPKVKVGDSWIEQDVYGEAHLSLLPGRQ